MINNFFECQLKKTISENEKYNKIKSKNLLNIKKKTITFNHYIIRPETKQMNPEIYHIKQPEIREIKEKQTIQLDNSNIKIIMMYQYLYNNNVKSTGLGDFIRGCFFLLQFSDNYNVNIDFSIFQHPIKNYLDYFLQNENEIEIDENVSKNIIFFKKENYEYFTTQKCINYKYINIDTELINFINTLKSKNNTVYLYLINHPNEDNITQEHKNKICNIFKPSHELDIVINKKLLNIKLTKKCYKIIHLRMNDDCFYNNNNTISSNHIKYLVDSINKIKSNTRDDILLISNSHHIKLIILKYIPTLKSIFCNITHICDKQLNDVNDTNIINTLTEFFIMSYSNYIYSFSVYEHGSGFSKWCAVAYNIPYLCYRID